MLSYKDLTDKYYDAVADLRCAQVQMRNFAVELQRFIETRDALREHPDFDGALPVTFFSDGCVSLEND